MLPIILIIFTGYISARFSLFSHDSSEQFTRLAFYIAIPCQVFYLLSKMSFSQVVNFHYILAYAICTVITGKIVFIISSFILKKSFAESSLNIMGSSMTNTAYFAIPLFILLCNNPAPVISILLFQLLILTTFILCIIEYNKKQKLSKNIFLISMQNPIIAASILGILFSFYHFNVPIFFDSFLNITGSTAAPLVLFALGQSLYSDITKIEKNDLIEVLMLVTTKLFVCPILAFFIGKYVFVLNQFWLSSLIIMSAMPTPNNMFIFAMKYQLDVKKASMVVLATTLLSFFTLNLLFFVFLPSMITK